MARNLNLSNMDYSLRKDMDSSKAINKATYSNVVGKCMDILKVYLSNNSKPSLEGFEFFYIEKQGLKGLDKAIRMVMEEGYSLENATEYIRLRVFDDTWNGAIWELEAKKWLLSNHKLDCRFANWEEDSKYCVDLVGKNFAIQVKPITYKRGSNPSLVSDRKVHQSKHRAYEKLTNKRVGYVFYNKNTNELKLERYEK